MPEVEALAPQPPSESDALRPMNMATFGLLDAASQTEPDAEAPPIRCSMPTM